MDLQRLAETLPDIAFYELSAAGEVRDWSKAAEQLFGFSTDEVVGRSLAELAARANITASLSALEEAAQNGRSETFGLVVRKDGSRFWANEITVPIRDEAGRTMGYAKVVRDATSWKAAQEERDRIFTLSADLICVAGFDGFFKRVNPAFRRVLGYTEAELLGRPFVDFVHPDDVAATRVEADANTEGQGQSVTQSFQNRYRRSDGTYCWLEWKTSIVAAEQLVYAVARDVTDQKAIDEKLQEYSRELERSNGELQQFAYVASHDLQEPLRAVAGCVQMLGERNQGKLDERSVELMGHAIDGAKRMATLINDLLAYSRVGSKGITKAWIDLRPVVEKAVHQLQVAVVESDAAVTIEAMPHAWADAAQLTQLFQNLIANAIKFRGERRPEIRISAEQAKGEVIFSVRDNGIGIAPEYHDRAFGLFQRLNSRKAYSGTGIGLAICKKIADRHGGRIWFESQAGDGANFRFTIPIGTTS